MSDINKIQKEYPDFCNEVQSLTADELKARIVALQQALDESEEHKAQNMDLRDARHVVSELAGPYRDVKKAVKAKTSYLIELLKNQGT
jgi:hypothetical protein